MTTNMVPAVLLCTLMATFATSSGATFYKLVDKLVPDVPSVKDIAGAVVDIVPNPLNVIFTNSCIEDYGCFYTGPPFFSPLGRPIPLAPSNGETIFRLFTAEHQDVEYDLRLSEESARNSSFNPEWPTKILVHGYRSDLDVDDIRYSLKDRLLNTSAYNVIVVDWTADNDFPYSQAASNTRLVGAKVAKLIDILMETHGLRAEDVHIIGHSLGAHVAGYAGERIEGLGRITGLDPAAPYFRGTDPEVRLDTTDANFVDVIHSDGGEFVLTGLGMSEPIGHQDFYPNGGRWQPGCSHPSESENLIGKAINITQMYTLSGCDHGMASEYFLESIFPSATCRFLGVQCSSYTDFEEGKCPPGISTVAEMGFGAKPIPGLEVPAKFFLRTGAESPYCLEDSINL